MTTHSPSNRIDINVEINGRHRTVAVNARDTLADHLRNDQNLPSASSKTRSGAIMHCSAGSVRQVS